MPIVAAAYARYSSDNQRSESIDAQLRAIRQYCEANDIILKHTYIDEALSATNDDRPNFLRMIVDAGVGLFDQIIVHKLDRFARNRYDSAFYRRKLKQADVKLISVLEQFGDGPEGVLLESVMEGYAEYYSLNLSREVKKGLQENALQCKATGGRPLLGYDYDAEKRYVINLLEAEAVQLIFTMYAAGYGYSAILDALNEKGFRTKRGQAFGRNSLHDILRNERYTGVYTYGRMPSTMGVQPRNGHRRPENMMRIEDGMPRIISNELWEVVKARMDNNQQNAAGKATRRVYILSGKVFCAECGSAMVGCSSIRHGKTYTYYECSTAKRTKRHDCKAKAIPAPYLDDLVIQALWEELLGPEAFEQIVDEVYETSAARADISTEKLQLLRMNLRQVNTEIKNIIDAIAAGGFHISMSEKLTALEMNKQQIQDQIVIAEKYQNLIGLPKEKARAYLARYTVLPEANPRKQREIIRALVHRIIISKDEIEIQSLVRIKKSPELGNEPDSELSETPSGNEEGFGYDGAREGNVTISKTIKRERTK